MITQYLHQILGYHVEFKVRLVSKPLVHVVLSNLCKYSWAIRLHFRRGIESFDREQRFQKHQEDNKNKCKNAEWLFEGEEPGGTTFFLFYQPFDQFL